MPIRSATPTGSPPYEESGSLDPDRARMPWPVETALALAGAGLFVAGAQAVDALTTSGWPWIIIGGIWVTRQQLDRWWAFRNGHRSVSWLPAFLFASTAVSIGYVAAASIGPERRAFAIYLALVVGWQGGDVLDWALRRRQSQRTRGEALVSPR